MRKTENYSPLDPITDVLVFTPGTEAVLGLLMNNALFEENASVLASVLEARREHREMVEAFKSHGINVTDLRSSLGKSLKDPEKRSFPDAEAFLNAAKAKAMYLKACNGIGDLGNVYAQLEHAFISDVANMGEQAAIEVNAVLCGMADEKKRRLDRKIDPIPNMMFARDYLHVTGGELVTNAMRFDVRRQEVPLAQKALSHEGIPFSKLHTAGSLEGGDIMPLEFNNTLFAAIGKAERTDERGVHSWYNKHERKFSASGDGLVPIIVEGPNANTQDQMHLDLVWQQVGSGAAVFCSELAEQRVVGTLLKKKGMLQVVDRMPMIKWIEKTVDDALEISRQEQQAYATNLLFHGRDGGQQPVAFLTRTDTPRVTEFISQHAEIVLLNLIHLTKFYGGVHCLTTEFRR